MSAESLKTKLRTFIYLVLSFLIAIITVRIVLKLMGASSEFSTYWYNYSYFIVYPFEGLYQDATTNTGMIAEFKSIFSVFIYFTSALLISKSLDWIVALGIVNKLIEILNILLKGVETILVIRIIMRLTGANYVDNSFGTLLFQATEPLKTAFVSLFKDIKLGGSDVFVFELSIFIFLLLVIIIDVLFSILFSAIKKAALVERKSKSPSLSELKNSISTQTQDSNLISHVENQTQLPPLVQQESIKGIPVDSTNTPAIESVRTDETNSFPMQTTPNAIIEDDMKETTEPPVFRTN